MENKRLSSCAAPSALHSSPTVNTNSKMVSPLSEEKSGGKGSKSDILSFSESRKWYENKNSIELVSYDEGSVVGKAMRKLQSMYGYDFQGESHRSKVESMESSHTESPYSRHLSPSTAASSFSSLPRRTLPPFPRHSRPVSFISPHDLGSLSSDLLIRCFSFCPLKTLVELSSVNRRFHALSCTNSLWIPFASFYGVTLHSGEDYSQVKERIRECVIAQRRVKEQEVRQCKEEYALLKRRIKAKSDAIRANPIDIDATLQESSSFPALPKGFFFSDGSSAATNDASVEIRVSGDFVFNLQSALTELECLRAQILDRLENNNLALKRHEKSLLELERSLEMHRHRSASHSNPSTFFGSATSGTAVEEASVSSSNLSPNSRRKTNLHGESHSSEHMRKFGDALGKKSDDDFPSLTFEEVLAFERRLVKLVINGKNLAPSTANIGVKPLTPGAGREDGHHRRSQGADKETRGEGCEETKELSSWMALSPVFRRGMQDFGSLELLLCVSSDSEVASSVLKGIQKRYDAFKRFFPLNDDYYTLKSIVSTQNRSSNEGFCTESASSSLNGSGPSATPNVFPITTSGSVPKKYKSLYKRITLLIRRIQVMKDSDVLSTLL